MATTTQITPEAALAKFNAFVQSQQMQDYLSQRQQQYTSTPKGGTEWTGATVLDNPFAGLTDFGKKNVDIYGTDELIGNVVGQEEVAKTASDVMMDKFGARLGHKSTFIKAYKKDGKGNPVEVEVDSLTPEELNSGDVVLYMGGATGGTGRERMAQAYIPQGDKLIPVGDPEYYKGEHPDARNVATALKIAAIASLPFGGIGGMLGGATSSIAGGIASLGVPQMAANIGANALLSGAVQGGISKALGGDFSKGFKSGAISGGIGAGVGELGVMSGLDKGLGSLYTPAKSLTTSALTAKVLGQPFDLGQAAKGAAVNYGLTQAIGAGGRALGMDAKQQNALFKFLNFAAPMIAARRKP